MNYRVSIKDKDGKFAVFVEHRAQHSGTGMPMGSLDTIDQASTVAHFLQTAFHDCQIAGLNEAFEKALRNISKPSA